MPMPNGPKIKSLRKNKGIKPGDFAARIGVAKTTLRVIEWGRRPASDEVLNRIANELGAEVTDLYADLCESGAA